MSVRIKLGKRSVYGLLRGFRTVAVHSYKPQLTAPHERIGAGEIGLAATDVGGRKLLLCEKFLKLLSLFRIFVLTKIIHRNKLYFICFGQRRIYSFSVDEFAHLRQDLHAFLTEEIVDERLARIRMGRFVAD